ncbi:MAG: DUF6402 family protein [Zoogloeaceae bacterium]|jgi:hypothetical protein|nr:DUF6402 family protein [Zoogloeaceae bacterium]
MKPMKKSGHLLLALLLATSAVQGDTPSTTSNNPLGLPQYEENSSSGGMSSPASSGDGSILSLPRYENLPRRLPGQDSGGLKVCRMPKPLAKAKTAEPEDPCAKLETRLPELPNIMHHLRWINGEKLMRDWFSRTANNDPKKDKSPNIDTIKMDWVLKYERAKKVYDQAIAEKVWVNAPAQSVIIDKLIDKKGKLPDNVGDVVVFGDVGAGRSFTPDEMKKFDEDYQFQYRTVNSGAVSAPLDDLFAALGDFNFDFVTQGTVERLPDVDGKARYEVTLDKVGIYVKDSYDFNDDPAGWNPKTWASQPLGYWNCAEQKASKTSGSDFYYVNNKDFREWREEYGNGKGGDFMVFSNIKVITVNDTFEF